VSSPDLAAILLRLPHILSSLPPVEPQRGETGVRQSFNLFRLLRICYGINVRQSFVFAFGFNNKGFDKSNPWNMRSFFLTFPKTDAVRQE
jgi:hypothetical protein